MNSRFARRLVLVTPVLVVGCLATAFIIVQWGETVPSTKKFGIGEAAFLAPYIAAAATGAMVVIRKPRHAVGWALFVYGLLGGVGSLFYGLAVLLADAGMLTAARWSEGSSNGVVTVAFVLIPLALLRFPTGAALSRRWRPFEWAMIAAAVLGFTGALVNGGFGGDLEGTLYGPGPLRSALGGVVDVLVLGFFPLLMLSVLAALTSVVVRFRRSSAEEREQVKWVATAAALLVLALVATALQEGAGTVPGWSAVLPGLGLTSIPVAMAVAILKYRLYDIDIVISRSLTYGALALFIGTVYVGIVVGIGELLGRPDSANFGLSIVATAVVAIAFQTVRKEVERWANRLVYGARATPYEVLAQFGHGAAEVSDGELLDRVPRLVADGTGAEWAALWVRSPMGFVTASSWPAASTSRTIAGNGQFVDPDGDHSMPVFHDNELLGGVSLLKERGDALTPTEEELLRSLADGLGLALRNSELTALLRRQVGDLEQSRDRLVNAADDARRSLEHDLDSGPQQQLVAAKVMLGPIRKMAERQGAEKTAQVLADVEAQAGDAIQAVREFAGGIYPPLLEAEGLTVALGHQARKAALPISVHAENVGRYPRDVESALYFTILEALQNTSKYAEASAASVALVERAGALRFEVRDDGAGFDAATNRAGVGLNGMADRIDTVGGSLHIESAPGLGTIIAGSVPVPKAVRS